MKVRLAGHVDSGQMGVGFSIQYQTTVNDPWVTYPAFFPWPSEEIARLYCQKIADEGLESLNAIDFPPWTVTEYEGTGGV